MRSVWDNEGDNCFRQTGRNVSMFKTKSKGRNSEGRQIIQSVKRIYFKCNKQSRNSKRVCRIEFGIRSGDGCAESNLGLDQGMV